MADHLNCNTPFDKAKEDAADKRQELYDGDNLVRHEFLVGADWAKQYLEDEAYLIQKTNDELNTLCSHNLKCYQDACNDIAKLQKALAVARGALELFCDDACELANINGVFCSDETLDAAKKALTEIKEIVGEK